MAILTKRNLAYAALALGLDVPTGGVVVYTRGAAEVLAVAKTAAVSSKAAALVAAKGAVVGTGLAVKGFVITVGECRDRRGEFAKDMGATNRLLSCVPRVGYAHLRATYEQDCVKVDADYGSKDIIQQVDILMGGLVHRRVDWPAFIRRSITRFVKAGLLVGGTYCTVPSRCRPRR
jgi:hypothetical protein